MRGVCCCARACRASATISACVSIVGRFLEHSRIFYFRNGGHEEVYLGSADLMPRNINRRVEVLFPVEKPALLRYVRDKMLWVYLDDNVKAREMMPDGSYRRLQPGTAETPVNAQLALLRIRTTR